MPILAATAATMRVWLDCTPPIETRVSAFEAMASGTMYSSLRSLLPPSARPELQSSRFAQICTFPPSAAVMRGRNSIGVGPEGQLVLLELVQAQHCALLIHAAVILARMA